jgi:hypothetical protein
MPMATVSIHQMEMPDGEPREGDITPGQPRHPKASVIYTTGLGGFRETSSRASMLEASRVDLTETAVA